MSNMISCGRIPKATTVDILAPDSLIGQTVARSLREIARLTLMNDIEHANEK